MQQQGPRPLASRRKEAVNCQLGTRADVFQLRDNRAQCQCLDLELDFTLDFGFPLRRAVTQQAFQDGDPSRAVPYDGTFNQGSRQDNHLGYRRDTNRIR